MNLLQAENGHDSEARARSPTRNAALPAQRLIANASRAQSAQMPNHRVSRSLADGGWTWFWAPSEYGNRSRREAIAQCRAAVAEDADASGAMQDLVALANPPAQDGTAGVRVEFDGSDTAKARAESQIRKLLARLHLPLHEIVNHELREVYQAGASSLEWYPNPAGNSLAGVEFVPPEELTQRRSGDLRQYWQDSNTVPMHPLTFAYSPYGTTGRDEMGRPAMMAALTELERKAAVTLGIDKVVRLIAQGVFLKIGVPKPDARELGVNSDLDPAYADALAEYYAAYVETAASARDLGIMAVEDGTEASVVNLTGNVSGMSDLEEMNALKVWSGLLTLPFMRGKMDSTTQALAQVVYPILLAHAANMRQTVTRSIEFGLNLELRLAGIPAVARLAFQEASNPFRKDHAEADLAQAQVDEKYAALYGDPYIRWAAERDGFDPRQVIQSRRKAAKAANKSNSGGNQSDPTPSS